MRLKMISLVARQQILSVIRDRRTLISAILMPFLILPLMMLGLPLLMGGLFERETETVSAIAVVGKANMPTELIELIEANKVVLTEVDDPYALVESGDYLAALEIPTGFSELLLQEGERPNLKLYTKPTSMRSELISGKLEQAISSYEDDIVADRLSAVGLDRGVLRPLSIERVDASSEAERNSGMLAWLIPFFMIMWTYTGGQMAAIDATAGEKERGTLEALLVSPVRRSEAVVGKFLATLTFGLSSAVMAILGYFVGGAIMTGFLTRRMGPEAIEIISMMSGSLSLNLQTAIVLILTSLLIAAFIAALLISIAMFARNYKQAQSYIAPLTFLIIIPAMALQFSEFFNFGNIIYAVPILNALLLIDATVKGNATMVTTIITWVSLVVFTGLMLMVAHSNFRRESVLFRT